METMNFNDIATIAYIDNEIIQQASIDGIEDIKTCSINEWKALLFSVGSRLFPKKSKILKIDNNIFYNPAMNLYSNNNMYDFYKLDRLCDIYIYLSNKYSMKKSIKYISQYYYCLLINVGINNIDILLNRELNINNEFILDDYIELYNSSKLNSIRLELRKKLKIERENNLKEGCLESGNAVGIIAIGNAENGWNTGNKQQITDNNRLLTVENLPRLTD